MSWRSLKFTKSGVVQLTAANGSHLEISGKAQIEFKAEGLTFQQDFIVAKIQGSAGILPMDILVSHEGDIKIKKHILKTPMGRLKLHKQTPNACTRIVIADSTTIPAKTKTLLHCKVDHHSSEKNKLVLLNQLPTSQVKATS